MKLKLCFKTASAVKTMCAALACIPLNGMGAAYVAADAVANENVSGSSITIETGLADIQGEEVLSPSYTVTDGEYTMTAEGDITVNNKYAAEGGTNSGAVGVDGEGAKLVVTAGGDIYLGSNDSSRNGAYANLGGVLEISAGVNGTIYAEGTNVGLGSYLGSRVEVHGNVSTSGTNDVGGVGLCANDGSVMIIHKNAATTGGAAGISAVRGGSMTVLGAYSVVDSALGIRSNGEGSSVTINGVADIRVNGTSENHYGIISVDGASVVLNGGRLTNTGSHRGMFVRAATITANAAQYSIQGDIHASEEGLVSFVMNGKSSFRGMTRFQKADGTVSTGTVNLTLQDDSLWTVTGNSMITNLTLGQGSALQLAFSGSSLTDIISATGAITLEAGSYIYLTGDLSGLEGSSFDFFDGTLVNNGVKFVGFDGSEWVEYEYTQTGANTFAFSTNAPVVIEEPGFIPEPATATLGLLGLASLMMRRRRA